MDHVFACDSRVVSHPETGVGVNVTVGQHWPADDPVVKAYPALFTADPRFGLSSSRPLGEDGYPVGVTAGASETTTAAPGERRSRRTRKAAKKTPAKKAPAKKAAEAPAKPEPPKEQPPAEEKADEKAAGAAAVKDEGAEKK